MTDDRSINQTAKRMVNPMVIGELNGWHGKTERDRGVREARDWTAQFPGLALDGVEFFIDQYGDSYVSISDVEDRHQLPVKSEAFRNWLIRRYLDAGVRRGTGAIRDDVATLAAIAGREKRMLHNRSAFSPDNSSLYIDLADKPGRVAMVEAGKWEVINDAPVRFQRLAHQEALPYPDRQGDLRKVLDLLPPMSLGDQLLVLTWTVAALVPFPRPILMLLGPAGSGKTSMSRVLRRVLDPSKADLLGQDGRADLPLIFAQHAVPVFDNVDTLPKRECDLMCRGVTGGAMTRRVLFSDSGEFIRRFMRTLIISALAPPTNRADLLDRTLIISLDRLTPDRRQGVRRLDAAFEEAWPSLFGGLLNALSATLAILDRTDERNVGRMADFHHFGRATAIALGSTAEQFDAAMRVAEKRQIYGAADNTLVAAIAAFARQQRNWVGDMPSLLARLIETAKAHQLSRPRDSWPETPIGLGKKLETLRPALAEHGVSITRVRSARVRSIHVEYSADADGHADD
jgi:hypothetical protein